MKGLILAAGYGTKFLPISKAVPAEMLPLVDKPLIELVVQEFLDAGINEILMISSRRKKVMEDYFDRELEMESVFAAEGALKKLHKLTRASEMADIHFLRQKELLGTGHAIYLARRFLGDEPFALAYPSNVFLTKTPAIKQLMDLHYQTNKHVIGATPLVNENDTQRFGVMHLEEKDGIAEVKDIREKPMPGTFPEGKHLSVGRYIFKPEIIPVFGNLLQRPRPGDVIFQTDAIKVLPQGEVIGKVIEGKRLNNSTPLDYIKSFTTYALQRPEFSADYKHYLRDILKAAKNGSNITF